MQAPACGNCLRRNEACEYPIFGQEWSPSVEIDDTADVDAAHTTLLGSSHQDQPQTLHPLQATSNSQPMDKNTLPGDTNAILSRLFSYSWFTPQEKAVWLPALSKLANKYSYIHHCALALTSLREEPWAHRIHRTPAAAYQHQVEASSLFRQSGPTVDENNWLAVLAFGTCNLIFQFHTQNSCEEAHFDLVETLRVVRSTTDIQTAANPFFHRSELWRLILSRTGMPDAQPDLRITQSLQDLAHVVSDTADECNSDDDEATADINRQAFWELKIWAYQCGGEPRRWDQYCQWPSQVTIEYLDLLDDGNDVALLIFIYWSGTWNDKGSSFGRVTNAHASNHASKPQALHCVLGNASSVLCDRSSARRLE
jgi:hypothetical protein